MKPDFKITVDRALAEADQVFADTGDVMVAIEWSALAAKAGVPLPQRIGQWLHRALNDYRNEVVPTMDAAMGLDKRGQGHPRRKRRSAVELNDALGRMWFLIAAGADRTQAAALVAKLTGRQVEQLHRSYGSSWFARRTDRPFDGMQPVEVRDIVVGILADYPDGPETEQEKAAILGLHPAPGPWQVKGRFGGWAEPE